MPEAWMATTNHFKEIQMEPFNNVVCPNLLPVYTVIFWQEFVEPLIPHISNEALKSPP